MGDTLTSIRRTFREVCGAPSPLSMRVGVGCGPTYHLVGGGLCEGEQIGAIHPQPDTIEGYPIVSEDLGGGGALQILLHTLGICEELFFDKAFPGPILHWRVVHTFDEPPGYG